VTSTDARTRVDTALRSKTAKEYGVLTAILILLLGACVALVYCRRRVVASLLTCGLVLITAAGTAPLPTRLLEGLQGGYATNAPATWGQHPAIVVLGIGTETIGGSEDVEVGAFSQSRLLKAIELYRACEIEIDECLLVISGGDPQGHGQSEAGVYAKRLKELGVESDDIVQETASRNTWENAKFTSQILKTRGVDQVIVVTSGFHLRRAAQYFGHFGTQVVPVRADYVNPHDGVMPQAFNLWLTTVALHEYIGMARYHVYNTLGWNT